MSFENILAVIITSVLPIAELRGGIPLGIAVGLDPLFAIPLSIFANALVFFPVYFGLELFFDKLLFKWKFVNRILERSRNKGKPYIDKYGLIGLAVFVGVPLPLTGAWTGTILAWILGLNWKKSFLAVALGVIIAGVIVSLISLGVLTGLKFLL